MNDQSVKVIQVIAFLIFLGTLLVAFTQLGGVLLVYSFAHVSRQAEGFGVLDDLAVFPAQVVSHEVNN